MTQPKLRRVLASRLRELMERSADLRTQQAIAKRSGMAQTTISRILSQRVAATLDNVESLALAFGIQAADMLEDRSSTESIHYDHRKYGRLPETEKARIASFIEFTLAGQASKNVGALTFVENSTPSKESSEAAQRAASKPIRGTDAKRGKKQSKVRSHRTARGKQRI